MVNYLAKDYKNPARNEELKKTLSVAQMIPYLEKNPLLIMNFLMELISHFRFFGFVISYETEFDAKKCVSLLIINLTRCTNLSNLVGFFMMQGYINVRYVSVGEYVRL